MAESRAYYFGVEYLDINDPVESEFSLTIEGRKREPLTDHIPGELHSYDFENSTESPVIEVNADVPASTNVPASTDVPAVANSLGFKINRDWLLLGIILIILIVLFR